MTTDDIAARLRETAEAAICIVPPDADGSLDICEAHSELLFDGLCEDGVVRFAPTSILALLDERDRLFAVVRLMLMRHHDDEADIAPCDVCRAARATLRAAIDGRGEDQ